MSKARLGDWDLWNHLGPLGHHGVAHALHLVRARVQQDWVLVDQLRALL